jgi:hypothetical protein
MSIWETLSRIDCSQHIEKKGQFSYLSWSWCWSIVKEHYPAASWHLEPEVIFPDGTVEVRITVSIEDQTATMWLPVMDFKNNAKPNPTSRDVSDTRMRCLVKCVAVGFGLGHYIYAGESTPQEKVVEENTLMIQAGAQINDCLERDDYPGAAQLWMEWSQEELAVIARAPSKGGQLTTANRLKMRGTEFRLALNEARGIDMSEVGK